MEADLVWVWGDLHAHSNWSYDGCEDPAALCAARGEAPAADFFQAADEEEMSQWVSSINQVASGEQEGEAGKAHTMPAGALGEKEPKKRSFFTLKKK